MEIFFPRIPIETSILVGKQIHKKLYYSSGIISLILLPLAFCFFAKRTIQRSTLGEMNLIWMDTIQLKKMDNLSPNPIRHYPPIRNYTDIVFTGNQREDLIKLEFAGIRIREILKANDTINGLHFLFLEKIKIWNFR